MSPALADLHEQWMAEHRRLVALLKAHDAHCPITMRFDRHALRTARRAVNLNQRDLARLADVHPSTISRLERRGGDPRIDVMQRLCQVLGVSADTLVHEMRA